jgi:hypothetical protein
MFLWGEILEFLRLAGCYLIKIQVLRVVAVVSRPGECS